MATRYKNLSVSGNDSIPDASSMKFGIAVAEWNNKITSSLLKGALTTLKKYGARSRNISVKRVPGTFELTLCAQFFAEYTDVDAVICLGCVIRGETPHFDYICKGVTIGLTELNLDYNKPFIFGILTTNNMEQAIERSGGKYGNKGDETAVTAIKMVALQKSMEES